VNRPNRQILLAERPDGPLELHHFREATTEIGEPGPGQVLCRTVLLSIDPANRAWMQGRTYREQLSGGEVMAGFTLGEVIAGELPWGTIIACDAGWQEYAVLSSADVRPVTVRGELTHYLGALGLNGLTAYFGLLEVGRPGPGRHRGRVRSRWSYRSPCRSDRAPRRFIVTDFLDRWPHAVRRLATWLADGKLVALQDIIEGLHNAPAALIGLLKGDNVGKRIVRVGSDPR